MSTYSYAGKVCFDEELKGVIIDAAQIAVSFSRFQRGIVARSPDQLNEWYAELGYWFEQAERYARDQVWPKNDKNCFRCDFRKICSKAPSVREQWLKADFTKRLWNPLIARGDI